MKFAGGTCFWNANRPPPPNHFWFLPSDPAQDSQRVLVANLNTWRDDAVDDPACILKAGDHPQVKHKTYVNYQDAKLHSIAQLELWARAGLIAEREATSKDLLELMQQGALDSEFCRMAYKKLLVEQGLPTVD